MRIPSRARSGNPQFTIVFLDGGKLSRGHQFGGKTYAELTVGVVLCRGLARPTVNLDCFIVQGCGYAVCCPCHPRLLTNTKNTHPLLRGRSVLSSRPLSSDQSNSARDRSWEGLRMLQVEEYLAEAVQVDMKATTVVLFVGTTMTDGRSGSGNLKFPRNQDEVFPRGTRGECQENGSESVSQARRSNSVRVKNLTR